MPPKLGRQIVVWLEIVGKHTERDQFVPLHFVWDTDGSGFDDSSVIHEHRLNLSRPEPLSCHFDRVVRTTEDVPGSIIIHCSKVTVHPNIRPA